MTCKTHAAMGAAAALAVTAPESVPQLFAVTAAAVFGGILPDVDLSNSKAGKMLNTVVFVSIVLFICILAIAKYLNADIGEAVTDGKAGFDLLRHTGTAAALIYFALVPFSGHRGFTHSIAAVFLVFVFAAAYFTKPVCAAFTAGYVVHMLADLTNKKGEQLFFPVKKRYCLNLCGSNGVVCRLLFLMSVIAGVLELAGRLCFFYIR